jgi:ABC-type antimicrobial peptide transport system permease subunit
MKIPYAYSWKNLWTRKMTTILTAGGLALVVYVFATVLMLAEGLQKTLADTGQPDNVMVIRRGSQTEVQSAVDREQAALIGTLPEIALGSGGERLISRETLVLMVLPKRDSGKPSNVTIRGLSEVGLALRPQVRLLQGRMFRPGSSEIVAGSKIARGFKGAGLGETLRFGLRDWRVVGVFDAGNTGFSSEIWGDADQLMQTFRRTGYSSVIFKLADATTFEHVKSELESNSRLTVEAKRETVFYAEQSEQMVKFLTILGLCLSVVFSLGAIIGAIITMYGSVASRTREIGALRAIGFHRASILWAFIMESLFMGLVGGLAGVAMASAMQFVSISTMNWQTFSELAFTFSMTPAILFKSLGFALGMGFLGGALPAYRASRLDIVEALRAI